MNTKKIISWAIIAAFVSLIAGSYVAAIGPVGAAVVAGMLLTPCAVTWAICNVV